MSVLDSTTTSDLLAAVEQGDKCALNELLAIQQQYLRRLVDIRLEPDLRGRIDPSDVVQETLMAASRRIRYFLKRRTTSFRVWLRNMALERLIDQRRHHHRRKRDVANELPLSDTSSLAVARRLIGNSGERRFARRELLDIVRAAMDRLSSTDREVLLLRHAEELTNAEAAEVLKVEPKAASARYGRAVLRLSVELRRRGIGSN